MDVALPFRRKPRRPLDAPMPLLEHLGELRRRFLISALAVVVAASIMFVLSNQLWRFITPGLSTRERRYVVPFVASSILLFVLGAAIALLTLEPALKFLIDVGGSAQTPLFTADRYLSLVSLMIVAFGLSFEFPVVLVFLLIAGVLTTHQLRKIRRWSIVGIVAFAAVITPSQDPYSLFFMAAPMYLFYEASIVLGRILKR